MPYIYQTQKKKKKSIDIVTQMSERFLYEDLDILVTSD